MKKKMRIQIAAVLAVVCLVFQLPMPAAAQSKAATGLNFTYRYDLDSTTLIYCRLAGSSNSSSTSGNSIQGPARIKTTGSSVNVSANTATQAPFNTVLAKDVISVARPAAATDLRVIQTRTDADTVTVDTAIDLTGGFEFRYWNTVCGSTAADGWIDVSNYTAFSILFNVEQVSGVTGGIDFDVECKGQALGDVFNVVHPGTSGTCFPGTSAGGFCNVTTTGQKVRIDVPPSVTCPLVRVGMKINTSDAAETVEADNERLTITVNSAQGK